MGLRYSEDCGVIVSLYVSRPAVSELKRQKYTYWCHSEFCRTSSSLCQLHSHSLGCLQRCCRSTDLLCQFRASLWVSCVNHPASAGWL
jgi:hypothetical protein